MNQVFFIQAGRLYDGRDSVESGLPDVKTPVRIFAGQVTIVILPPDADCDAYFAKYWIDVLGHKKIDDGTAYEYFVNGAF